jgi:uncharacterized DUF497 family protein
VHFVWDPRKAASNVQKHGVSFEEAVTVFADPLALIVQDEEHPERARLLGQSGQERILVTVFLEIDDEVTRIISARRATKHERRRYEDGQED